MQILFSLSLSPGQIADSRLVLMMPIKDEQLHFTALSLSKKEREKKRRALREREKRERKV